MWSDVYQAAARRTMSFVDGLLDTTPVRVLVYSVKLAGEAGEVCELIGKFYGHGIYPHDFREKLAKELGDVLWYVAAIATCFELDLGYIMGENLEKLKARYPNGFVNGGGIRG